VVAVVHQPADPSAPPVTIPLADVPAFVERLRPMRRRRGEPAAEAIEG